MLETYNVILANASRYLRKNIESSPFLYFLFTIIIVFSIVMFGMLTLFFIENEVFVDLNDVFFIILFLFILKSSYDFHNNYTNSPSVYYALSTPVSHTRTVFEIFLMVFFVQLGLWVLFSSLYNVVLIAAGINLGYPVVYLQFTFGIMLAAVLGTTITLHFFSKKKYRLIPIAIIFTILYIWHDLFSILLILIVSSVYLFWSLHHALDSYQYVSRKERKKEKLQIWIQNVKRAIFYKEIIVLWRDRILLSMIFSAVTLGIISGYLARFGGDSFLPEGLKLIVSKLAPGSYALFGIYVLTVYCAVFISLNTFLNEEHTLWLIRHLPVDINTVVKGKALALVMPFICTIPFVAYYSAFTSGESLLFLVWFLVFSFLAGVIISFPLGAKYVGKKSDILLLYSVSLIIFVILSVVFSFDIVFRMLSLPRYLFYILTIVFELLLLVVSLKVSSNILALKYKNVVKSI